MARLGGNIARLRRAAGMSQEELAARAGLSQSFVSNLERGRRRSAQAEAVQALARALGVTVEELLGGD